MDQSQPMASMMRDADGGKSGRGWNRWVTWRGFLLLAAVIVLPFGWILPLVHLARERASTRRRTNSYWS